MTTSQPTQTELLLSVLRRARAPLASLDLAHRTDLEPMFARRALLSLVARGEIVRKKVTVINGDRERKLFFYVVPEKKDLFAKLKN